jgi:hypothetical protein
MAMITPSIRAPPSQYSHFCELQLSTGDTSHDPPVFTIEPVGSKKPRQPPSNRKIVDETIVKRPGKGAKLKEEVWANDDDQVIKYSLAYINPRICPRDNGRVLGYENSHNYHHRHFMGTVEPFAFETYEALFDMFDKEVRELWRKEDEENR